MPQTILLRFRDLLEDTIEQHDALIQERGYVWWGWWKKNHEPDRTDELAELQRTLRDGPTTVGLFDRSTGRFFSARVSDCVYSSAGLKIQSPDSNATPEYYRHARVAAWFRLVEINEITQDGFVEQFSAIPVGEDTLFPAEHSATPITVGRVAEVLAATRGEDDLLPTLQIDPPVILHLSDLHFGRDFGFPRASGPGQRALLDIVSEDVRELGEDVGLVIISGDLTSRGDQGVLFNPVIPFLQDLLNRFQLGRDQLIIVPGNHDIALENYTPVSYQHQSAFDYFFVQVCGDSQELLRLRRFTVGSVRTIEILSINSVLLRTLELKNFGYTEWSLYDSLLRELPRPTDGVLRIAVLHHHLVSAPREEGPDPERPEASLSATLDAGTVTEGLQEFGFKIVLHGHQHVPRVTQIARGRHQDGSVELIGLDDPLYVIAGGSAGAKVDRLSAEMPLNSYGLLYLREKDVRLRVRQYTPAGITRDYLTTTLPV